MTASYAQEDAERLWDQLFQFIEAGRVIPVVGQDLLLAPGGRCLYADLAERLSQKLEIGAVEQTLNQVACRYLVRGGELEDLYSALMSVMPRADQLPVPESLLKLARLPFKLFVSLTFDNLLERAINQVRFEGRAETQVFAFSPQSPADLPGPIEMRRPAVFQLFGRLSAVPDYAVTDEDVLEFMHALQSETRRPRVLFDQLNRNDVLIVGSTFSGWLARFFFRIGRRERLSNARGKTDFVADRWVRQDEGLVYFLNQFRTRTKVFPCEAVEFVDELYDRWIDRQKARPEPAPEAEAGAAQPPSPPPGDPMLPGSVFLSYASEDRAVVERIKSALHDAGVDVWFDREQLELGDAYEAKIRQNIDKCSLFVPIISRHVLTPAKRFFWREWKHALYVAEAVPANVPFIVPVSIDGTPAPQERLPAEFNAVQWQALPEGQALSDALDPLRKLFRKQQKATAAA